MGGDKERREDYIQLGKMQAHLKILVEEVPKIREDVTVIREDVAGLKVKAGWYGAISGAVISMPVIGYLIIKIFNAKAGH